MLLDDAKTGHCQIGEISAVPVREKPFGENVGGSLSFGGKTYVKKILLVVIKTGSMVTHSAVEGRVTGVLNDMRKAMGSSEFVEAYKNVVPSDKMRDSITKGGDSIVQSMKNMVVELSRKKHFDTFFMDDTIKRLMTKYYSKGSVDDWDERAKRVAYKDGKPDDRFVVT